MRILVISQYFPPDGGGGSKRASNAVMGLVNRGHSVEVITAFQHYPHGKTPEYLRKKSFIHDYWKSCRIIRVWVPPVPHQGIIRRILLYIIFSISALQGVLLANHTDVIWTVNPNVFSSFPAIIGSIIKAAPIVRNVDDLWPETAIEGGYTQSTVVRRIGTFLAKIAYTVCNALTPISYTYKTELSTKYKIPPNKIYPIEVGVDTSIFIPQKHLEERRLKQYENKFRIMYSGVLGPGYNFDLLLEVAKTLREEEDIQFIIHGFGERARNIQFFITKFNLINVKFSTEFLPINDYVKLLLTADAFILPMIPKASHEAGIPTKLFEYLSLGKPIICCSDGEPAAIVRKAKSGIIVPPENIIEVVKAIHTLKTDPELRKEMGENGLNYAVANFSIDEIGRKLETVFNIVIG